MKMPRTFAASCIIQYILDEQRIPLHDFVYNPTMLESVFQVLAVYIFAATPCFAAWIANGGKREDFGLPVITSMLLFALFGVLIYFLT